ncbi:MAG: ribosome biogenesis GTPase Der [Candidatus Omnitrophica bacterium]|nr:ribosome biogenesis GTPase Der [Candidatus Omnitrophota bacterium]
MEEKIEKRKLKTAPYTVAIVGRPNVGKSTLFNRIVGERVSIVDDQPGVTRDVIGRIFEWNGVPIRFLDTGGYETTARGEIEENLRRHIQEAIELSDLLILVVDISTGPTAEDEDAMDLIRRSGRDVILAVNKADNLKREREGLNDFLHWGIEPLYPVSSTHGTGTGDLLDAVVDALPERPAEIGMEEEENLIRVAIVGRPNVGKSTLLNQLVGEKRSLVSNIPGTTRDPVDTFVEKEGQPYLLIDTAGIRRRGKIKDLEKYAVGRGKLAIERADVVLLVIDAEEGITETDAHVFGLTQEMGRAAILLVNKWDLVEKDTNTSGEYVKKIQETCKFLKHCPIQFISAMTGQRTHRVWEEIKTVYEHYSFRAPTSGLNNNLQDWVNRRPPHGIRGRHPKILYMTQVGVQPPTFALFVKNRDALHFSYERYLINQMRETYGFTGTPIRLHVRESRRRDYSDRPVIDAPNH